MESRFIKPPQDVNESVEVIGKLEDESLAIRKL